jgi:hypothetical protein
MGREKWEGKYLQYLSVEEFPKKRAPVTAFDRENGKGSGQGKSGKGTFMIGKNILDYAQHWTRKYARELDTKYARECK